MLHFMTEITPPCFSEACTFNGLRGSEHHRELCNNMFLIIIKAGGAALLETTICPWRAMAELGIESDDPDSTLLRNRLGIVGTFNDSVFDD